MEERTLDQTAINSMKSEIITLHNEIVGAVKQTLSLAKKAGELLLALKEEIPFGGFTKYVEENFPFSTRTAQRYIQIASHPELVEEKRVKMLSQAYEAVKQKEEEDEVSSADVEADYIDEGEEEIFVSPETPQKVFDDESESQFFYWPAVEALAKFMENTHSRLAQKRTGETPTALGNFIGNIKDMADRMRTWDPTNLRPCSECNAKGTIEAENPITGDIEFVECPYCINGYTGAYAPSKN